MSNQKDESYIYPKRPSNVTLGDLLSGCWGVAKWLLTAAAIIAACIGIPMLLFAGLGKVFM